MQCTSCLINFLERTYSLQSTTCQGPLGIFYICCHDDTLGSLAVTVPHAYGYGSCMDVYTHALYQRHVYDSLLLT